MKNRALIVFLNLAVALVGSSELHAAPAPADPPDPAGILRKPIPDKLVVLTFDDSPASHATIVAPILKSLGFGGTFYVCDFDGFRTRKDWYMTFRQMKALAEEGFEIGNHTVTHWGGLNNFLSMDDELLAHDCPRTTTVCWPVYASDPKIYPALAANGYIFGRGGYERPYRPTVDNPFDIPSFTIRNGPPVENFVKQVRLACQGKLVVFCFHGVPDMEHPGVSLDPEVFKVQMQYLKDNHYKVIAARDLAEYIDPVKAAMLPPTAKAIGSVELKDAVPAALASEEKPCGTVKTSTSPAASESKPRFEKPSQKLPLAFGPVKPIDNRKPNVFTWSNAGSGNWSDAAKWSNNLTSGSAPAAGGQADYVLNFNQHGPLAIKNDLNADFLLNRLILGDACGGTIISGNSITLIRDHPDGVPPVINAGKCQRVDINVPVNLHDDLHVNTSPDKDPNCFISFNDVISGRGALILNSSGDPNVAGINFHDVHFGILQINNSNTYSGGTIINGGKINVRRSDGLGTGPVTLDNFGTLSSDAVLANAIAVNNGTLFHCSVSGKIQLNGTAGFISDCTIPGGMSGRGGVTMFGTNGTYLNMVPGGNLVLDGTNTYAGPTTVFPGNLIVKKAASLYNGDSAKWTPGNITIHKAATVRLSVGGPGEFTGEQVGELLRNLTNSISSNGLMGGSVLCLDTSNAKNAVTISADIPDSKGPGGGAFLIKKCGAGTLQLSGKNTCTGQTILESGALSVSSLNSYGKQNRAASSLGAPANIETGEIVIGEEDKPGDCALIYTGAGETSDRVINLAGKAMTVTFDQSGTGMLKLTSTFVISGYGADKTLVLKGDTFGAGEIAGNIVNPYDRAGKAITSLVKSGAGKWILSGENNYAGPTKVAKGTLSLANANSLSPKTDVIIESGASLELHFKARADVHGLTVGGRTQPPGEYGATQLPKFVSGTGTLNVLP